MRMKANIGFTLLGIGLCVFAVLVSCSPISKNPQKKDYTIIVHERGNRFLDKDDTTNIQAETDSMAYCEAFKKMCVSKATDAKVREIMKQNTAESQVSFTLLNSEGTDITDKVSFIGKKEILNKIEKQIIGTLQKSGYFKNDNSNDSSTLWTYSQEKDELTGKSSYFAQLVSDNYTTFDFPYNHTPIFLTLNIRKSPRYGTDVYLTIPEGQFHTKYDGTYISVRFDNGSVIRYSCSEPSDNSTTVLFVNGAKGFIKKLKSSKECRISAEFYQEGAPTFIFKTKGLEWNH